MSPLLLLLTEINRLSFDAEEATASPYKTGYITALEDLKEFCEDELEVDWTDLPEEDE